MKQIKILPAIFIAVVLAMTSLASAQGKSPAMKVRLATPVASLSYLPIHVALKKGFFARRGVDVEVIQMAAGLVTLA